MLILYTSSSCPFCHRVKDYLNTAEISYEERDIYEKEQWLDDLIETGGKRQVPFLVDTIEGVSMYESADIVDYIQEKYADTHSDTSK